MELFTQLGQQVAKLAQQLEGQAAAPKGGTGALGEKQRQSQQIVVE